MEKCQDEKRDQALNQINYRVKLNQLNYGVKLQNSDFF